MKLRKITCVLLTSTLLTTLFYGTTFASNIVQNGSKRYIIKFKTSNIDGSQFVPKYSGSFRHQFKHINAAVADMTSQSLASLQNDPNVDYVEEDNPVKISSTAATQLTNWGVSDIKATASQQSGVTGKGVKVAIIDTGSGPHADLSIAGGTNVISGTTTTSYTDDNGHGTHVAGIIGGQGLNGGVTGVAPGASIYAVKALDSTGSGYTSDIITGIDWAIDNKMDIISMSLGSSQSDTSLQSAVDTAYNDGILIVAAAGNDGNTAGTGTNVEYPANYASVIAVAAVDSTNTRAYFSSTGSKVEVSAPGVNIESTYLNNSYETMSGTSMATPFIAGDLALLKQEYPSDTNAQLRALLDSKVIDLGTAGRDSLYGYGLIQAPSGTASVVAPVAPIASVVSGTYTSSQTVSLSDTTAGVSIYYTVDGTTPTSKSTLYSSPITVSATETLKAIAINSSGSSTVLSVSYIIAKSVVVPVAPIASVTSGTYTSSQTVSLSDTTAGVSIYYTVDGTTPTSKSTLYSAPIIVSSTKTLKAIAINSSGSSTVLSVAYTISLPIVIPVPIASSPSGSYKAPLMIQLYDMYSKPLVGYYTLDGSTPTTKSTVYNRYISITASCTLKVKAVDSLGNTSGILSNTYTIIKLPSNPVATINSKSQTITLTDSTSGVAIYYTTNGSLPTTKSTLYTGSITVSKSTTLLAVAIDLLGNSSQVVSAVYVIGK